MPELCSAGEIVAIYLAFFPRVKVGGRALRGDLSFLPSLLEILLSVSHPCDATLWF